MCRTSGLLHPVALLALAVLVVNDHVLKAAAPGWVTGKLSDLAGLVVFPLVAAALVARCVPASWQARVVDACAVATALGFAAAKLWAPATHACEWMLGALQWPLAHTGPIVPAWMVRDPTDLVALPMVALARWCFAADHARQNIVPVRLAA